MFNHGVDVAGNVMVCQKWWNVGRTQKCEAGDIHRLDNDLQLCVCKRCGQSWIRDVDSWTRLNEAFERLDHANAQLHQRLQMLKFSLQNLNNAIEEAEEE